ncbi:phosphate ABC transporter permease subunit PstC [Cytobacillus sp. T106]|uniref:Phosphate transport system permease protein n=1 Tax=Bacillus infantis NRRL B-14911 TaxID=1367477 RepID=U5LDN0_9BACI|nr:MULTISPECIES: phosphate ABC transporter permease subunit PstC [Bacillus]AGX05523.1 phosphate ABC transporter permease [Bacillus infantis NRRL B-14911]MCA1036234.1 phosphate ABC transporter permease subunit PstC [Bacillus infantis]MCP1159789.1 phosphate ABC transporter permease subunit PstC [Bacillus infantis]MDT0159924.1 phosphate ABC transporter permease subunit PstC [Bacillus sp. AG4(2022)]MDW2875617.1 phosphate ABC transporter permease subunit PstC [Bacillus infantis]
MALLKSSDTFSVQEMIQEKKQKKNAGNIIEKLVPWLLLLTAAVSVLTTIGIVMTLIVETFIFFDKVSIGEFLTAQKWYPFSESQGSYGILPLVSGTLKVTAIAVIVAVPIGLASAIFLSEYASDRTRRIIKPVLEVLAGIPTIVYGFFALTFVTPILRDIIPSLEIFNALSPGIVIGIMITPMIASLSEDAMSSVPRAMREGALAMGSTKLEVAFKVVLPAALSGIIASVVLAVSRAIGETMIVAVAGGSTPNLSWDVTNSIQTMTAYIVQVSQGDAGYGTTIYYSIYAVGFTLFLFTLVMNLFAQFISRRFREEY